MPLFSIDLSEEFQSFLIVEALSAAIGIGVMKLHSGRTFVSVLGYRVSRFSDGVFIGKICTVSSSTNRKPNMVKPMLLAVENPAIGKNCFHFYQLKTQDVSSQCRKTSISQKNIHQATYCKWNFQKISEMCNIKPSSKIILPQLEKSAGFKSAFN